MKNSLSISILSAIALMTQVAYSQSTVVVQTLPGFEAQLGDVQLPSGVTLPPGVTLPQRPSGMDGTNAPAKNASPEERRLQELLKLKFDRSPSAVLDAFSAQLDSSKAITNEVEQFRQSVIRGDWKATGEYLRTLPKDHGQKVYRYLIKQLPNAGKPASEPNQPSPEGMPEGMMIVDGQPVPNPGQRGAASPTPTLVLDDVLALAEIAPTEFTDEDAKALGQLLGRLLARGDALEPLLPRLEIGVENLGGGKSEDRRRAAEMLLAANRLAEAALFLPSLETAKEKFDWPALDQHARELAARGTKDKNSQLFLAAWDVNQFIIGCTNVASTNREAALKRCMDLLPQLSGDTGTNWLRARFQGNPAQGLTILAVANQLVQKGLNDRNTESRRKNLQLQKQLVGLLLEVRDPSDACWRTALNLLAQGWMQEATTSKQRYRPPRNYGAQYDQFGNMISYEPYPQEYYDGNQQPFVPIDAVLATAPDENWQRQLDSGLRLGLLALMVDLHLKTETPEKAVPLIEALAAARSREAGTLANSFLRAWGTAHQPGRNSQNMNSRYMMNGVMYYGGSPYGMQGQGIPLTRAMQVRNIQDLSVIMRRLQSLGLPRLDDSAAVAAFAGAHSSAEVFRTEDIEAVFGSRNQLKPDLLAGLAQTMRERLAQQWRQPRIQQEARTQRNDKQIEAEVLRGYSVVMGLIDEALKRDNENWRLNLVRSATFFDLAEFQYGKKVDLAIYVEKRDEAFKGFARAAELYARALPQMEERDETPLVYQQWFNANLGASDLAYVTRQQDPETNQLQRVKAAMLSLPQAAAQRHLTAFAKQLGQSANTLRPELKPRYLRAGLLIVGDHPDAADARKLVTYYDDLLRELELIVRLDGDASVGHGQPFGVFVSLKHTADIERESGGFARYLRNMKSANPYYYNQGGPQQRNFTEDFEKQVREKLADHFEVKTVTFLDDKVKSRGLERSGWRETPLAYLLLKAKDGSVDQIPTFRMDLDFMDSRGQVVLPVESQVTLIDARPDKTPARPVNDLEVTQILDDREIAQGKLSLEIKATGHGLIPDLTALLRTNFSGLRVEELSDPGLAIARIDTEVDDLAPVSERNWVIKLAVADAAPSSLAFKFPEPTSGNVKATYKRYADADLVEVQPLLALAGVSLRPRPWWHWLIMTVVAAVVIGGGAIWLRKQKPTHTSEQRRYALPEPATAFSLIALLRRMEADPALSWNDTDRAELDESIRRLEAHYFSRQRNGHTEPDLANIGRHWVNLASNGKS